MWPRMDHRHTNIVFLNFLNLIRVHIGQLGITFDKHADIQLNHRKYQCT
jgi:hypothetical protein